MFSAESGAFSFLEEVVLTATEVFGITGVRKGKLKMTQQSKKPSLSDTLTGFVMAAAVLAIVTAVVTEKGRQATVDADKPPAIRTAVSLQEAEASYSQSRSGTKTSLENVVQVSQQVQVATAAADSSGLLAYLDQYERDLQVLEKSFEVQSTEKQRLNDICVLHLKEWALQASQIEDSRCRQIEEGKLEKATREFHTSLTRAEQEIAAVADVLRKGRDIKRLHQVLLVAKEVGTITEKLREMASSLTSHAKALKNQTSDILMSWR